jgi:hypothetical protein
MQPPQCKASPCCESGAIRLIGYPGYLSAHTNIRRLAFDKGQLPLGAVQHCEPGAQGTHMPAR